MSIKTVLITAALVAGSSTAALARPFDGNVRGYRAPAIRVTPQSRFTRHYNRYDRYNRYSYRPSINYSYAPQLQPQQVAVDNGQFSQFLPLGGTTGNGLEIELVQGEDQAFVDQVIIHYADGRDVPMHLDRSLNAYDRELHLQTEPCAITGVTVIGSGAVTAERF